MGCKMPRPALDFLSPKGRRDPYPYYKILRRSTPILNVRGFGWIVSRFDDVTFVLSRPDLFSSSVMAKADATLLGSDPPAHSRFRRIVSRSFSKERVSAVEAKARATAEGLVAGISGEWDLVSNFAIPFPLMVMAELLGMAPERWPELKRWSGSILSANTGSDDPSELVVEKSDIAEFDLLLWRTIDRCRQSPGNDLISSLVYPHAGSDALTDQQIVSFSKLLVIAGSETTTNLIGNAVLALLRNPAELNRALSEPSLIAELVEETLRYDPPVQFVVRRVTQEVTISGVSVPTGARVVALLGSANRDEESFLRPDRFDIKRSHQINVAFGWGIHYCLGALLARLQAKIGLALLIPLLRRAHVAEDLNKIRLVDSIQLRGPMRLLFVVT
jgi:cytochrome P450